MKKTLIAFEIFLLVGIGGYLLFHETINQLFIDESAYRQGFYVPKDLEDSFDELDQILNKEDRNSLKSLSSEDDLSMYHFGLGTYLRNRWGLWGGSRFSEYFNELGIYHPDDMSGIILTSYWRHLNDLPLEVKRQVKYYQDYWEQVDQADTLLQDLPASTDSIKNEH